MRTKEELKEYIDNKFSNLFFEEMNFYSTYWMDSAEEGFEGAYDSLYDFLDNLDWISNGVTKLVLSFNDEKDWVFKIPFYGAKIVEDNFYPEDYIDSDFDYSYLHANKYHDESIAFWDYCSVEQYLFQESKDWELDDLFAETVLITHCDGYPIYASRRVDNPSFYTGGVSAASREKAKEMSKRNSELHMRQWLLAAIIDDKGIDVADHFVHFVEVYNIEDLHEDNVGTTEDGSIKILDYSSFDYRDLLSY